jgi:hypothetical protein
LILHNPVTNHAFFLRQFDIEPVNHFTSPDPRFSRTLSLKRNKMAAIATSGVAFAAAPLQPSTSTTQAEVSPLRTDGEIVLSSIEEAVSAIERGEFVVVVDDLDRENEGDLICSASKVTQQMMAWLIRHSS